MAVNNPDPNAEPNADPSQTFSLRYVQDLRQESASYRLKAKNLEGQLAKLGDAPATIRRLSIDNALLARGDIDVAYTRFLLGEENALADLDPSQEGWETMLAERVDDLLARNPLVRQQRRGPPVVRSGPDFPPGPGDTNPGGQLTRGHLQGMKPEDVVKAFNDGSLDQLLGRQR